MAIENRPTEPTDPDTGEAQPEADRVSTGEDKPERPTKTGNKRMDPAHKLIFIILPVCVLILAVYVLSGRYVPSSSQAHIHAYVVPIVPQVSGYVTEVMVANNQIVSTDQPLLQINRNQYELAVEKAEAALEQAGQSTGANMAAVRSAQASLSNAKAKLKQARTNYALIKSIHDKDPGAVSKFELTNRKTFVDVAISRVSAAEAELAKAREQLGKTGRDNAQIKQALSNLEKAKLDLTRTIVRSPGIGGITDPRIDIGQYANPGQPLMTFVSTTDVWVRADIRENGIEHIKVGNRAELSLDAAPGRVFQGEVASIGWGISPDSSSALGTLPTASATGGWLSDARRFPVIIKFSDDRAKGLLRPGGKVHAVIYTGDHPILNALSRAWLRILSVLSYAY